VAETFTLRIPFASALDPSDLGNYGDLVAEALTSARSRLPFTVREGGTLTIELNVDRGAADD
jgi:hypothetical protein